MADVLPSAGQLLWSLIRDPRSALQRTADRGSEREPRSEDERIQALEADAFALLDEAQERRRLSHSRLPFHCPGCRARAQAHLDSRPHLTVVDLRGDAP